MAKWIITGGSSGIGRQLVTELEAAGADVLIWDIQPPETAGTASYQYVDLLKPGSAESAAAEVTGPVHAFVHCAGVTAPTSIGHKNAQGQLRDAFEIHVVAFVLAVQGLVDRMQEGRGSAIAIVSAAMDILYPGSLAYGSTKAALRRVVNQLAVELGTRGIRVNGIAPGAVATPMTAQAWSNQAYAEDRRKFIPLGRQAAPEAVTGVIRFLASKDAEYITGETIYVDGGVRHGIFNQLVQDYIKTG